MFFFLSQIKIIVTRNIVRTQTITNTVIGILVLLALDFLFTLFSIAWCPPAGKELSNWIFASFMSCLMLYQEFVLLSRLMFQTECSEFDCIGSWSLRFHHLHTGVPRFIVHVILKSAKTHTLNERISNHHRDLQNSPISTPPFHIYIFEN